MLVERLATRAPYTVVKTLKSALTASSFCHYPNGTPAWNRVTTENRGHRKVTARGMAQLEHALREIASGRRSLTLAAFERR